jgi:hypothetical protein
LLLFSGLNFLLLRGLNLLFLGEEVLNVRLDLAQFFLLLFLWVQREGDGNLTEVLVEY